MMKKFISIFLLAILIAGCGTNEQGTEGEGNVEQDPIVISGKKWTEQYILPHLLAEHIQAKTDYPVEIREGLGEVSILTPAIQKGDIDMYVEYTGTGLEAVLKEKATSEETADEIFQRVKEGYKEQYDLVWLDPLGFENGYALAYPEEVNEDIQVETFTEFVPHSSDFVFGAPHQFYEREDGYDALVEAYGFTFKDTKSLDPNIMYKAVADQEVGVIPAFTTDGRIARFDLHTLKDDQAFFPPYYAAPVIRQDVLDQYPDLEEVINELGGIISEEEMAEMNAKVDIDGENPKDVAIQFLQEKGIIE